MNTKEVFTKKRLAAVAEAYQLLQSTIDEVREAFVAAAKDDKDAVVLPSDEHSKSEFSTGDAAKHLLALKTTIAKHGDKGAKDAYNTLCKSVRQAKAGVKDGAPDPFKMLANIAAGVDDSQPEIPIFQFFNNGKPYAENLKAYNEYTAARAQARR